MFTEQVQRQVFLFMYAYRHEYSIFLALKPGFVSQGCQIAIAQGKQSQEPQNQAAA